MRLADRAVKSGGSVPNDPVGFDDPLGLDRALDDALTGHRSLHDALSGDGTFDDDAASTPDPVERATGHQQRDEHEHGNDEEGECCHVGLVPSDGGRQSPLHT